MSPLIKKRLFFKYFSLIEGCGTLVQGVWLRHSVLIQLQLVLNCLKIDSYSLLPMVTRLLSSMLLGEKRVKYVNNEHFGGLTVAFLVEKLSLSFYHSLPSSLSSSILFSFEKMKTMSVPFCYSATLHPSGKWLVTGGEDFKLYKFDYEEEKEVGELSNLSVN